MSACRGPPSTRGFCFIRGSVCGTKFEPKMSPTFALAVAGRLSWDRIILPRAQKYYKLNNLLSIILFIYMEV